jgi:hypothetical protein
MPAMRRVLVVVGEVAPMAGVDGCRLGLLAGVLRDEELVALAGVQDEPALPTRDDVAGQPEVEVAVVQAIVNFSEDPTQSGVQNRGAG